MTPDERQLINGLFDRMRGYGAVEKDRDAEALINQTVRQMPDAPYMLVQSVLVQEHALQQADQRIRELEERVQDLESQARPAQTGGGSFLGGLFGGGGTRSPQQNAPVARGSVPSTGEPGYGNQTYRADAPMGAPRMGAPAPVGSPWGQPSQQAPMSGGGGFMRSAMTTAAGVAGGMLLANSISSMLGGGHSAAAATTTPHAPETAAAPQPQQQEPQYQDAANNDPGYDANDPGVQDASYDDGGDWGGGGDDFDI